MKCPWCEKYIEIYLRDDGTFAKEELEWEKERLNDGFWASISEVHDELRIVNKYLPPEAVLEMGMPMQIDMKSGKVSYGRFWCYSLAEVRDKVLGKELKHFWIQSGGCSISYMTSICCEMANSTSDEEQVEWELHNFSDLKNLTKKVLDYLKEESFGDES